MSTGIEKPQRISIGFTGGQTLGARIAPAELARLREALGGPRGWIDVTGDDGTVAIDLDKVVYLRVEHDEHRVGFGLSS